jgi:hypothetical protein
MASIYSLASMGVTVPDSVKRLVDHFDQNREVFLSGDYKEEQLRASSGSSASIRHSSFVIRTSPHESLGWDVANKAGLTEVFKPVTQGEAGIKVPSRPSVRDSARRKAHALVYDGL